jgi:hypothetical protein
MRISVYTYIDILDYGYINISIYFPILKIFFILFEIHAFSSEKTANSIELAVFFISY